MFFELWMNDCILELSGKSAFRESKINDGGYWLYQDIDARLEEECRNNIKRTRGIRGL